MTQLKIRTDHKWKQFKYRNEVPAKVLLSQFDWMVPDGVDKNLWANCEFEDDNSDYQDGFILYRNCWYHLSSYMRNNATDSELSNWDGFASDSYFSGTCIRISKDGERYQIGTYIS